MNVCASLDREVDEIGSDGGVEIKNRELANHIESISTGKVPDEYYKQVLFQLWVTHKKWIDYDSYADEMPENAKSFIRRVYRDEDMIEAIKERVALMEKQLGELTKVINAYKIKVGETYTPKKKKE